VRYVAGMSSIRVDSGLKEAPPQTNRKRWIIAPILLTAAAALGMALEAMHLWGPGLSPQKIYSKLFLPLFRLLAYLGVGLLVGQIVETLGWTTRLAQWVRPLTRWGHLKDESGAAFISSFVSGIVANTMLMGFYREEKLTRKELVLTYLLNNGLPVYLVHLPTTLFVVSSLAGSAGIVYLLISFIAACLRSLGALIYARITFPSPSPKWSALINHLEPGEEKRAEKIWQKFRTRFLRLVLYTFPIYVLVFLTNEWELFAWLRSGTAGWISDRVFPVEAAGVVIFTLVAEFNSGMAAAGALVHAGALTVKQTVLALVLGTIVATPLRAVRHQLPAYAGLFDLGLGTELLLMSQGLRIISLIAVTAPYAVWG
jgi:hypothetical protein